MILLVVFTWFSAIMSLIRALQSSLLSGLDNLRGGVSMFWSESPAVLSLLFLNSRASFLALEVASDTLSMVVVCILEWAGSVFDKVLHFLLDLRSFRFAGITLSFVMDLQCTHNL